jgi:hypothetical protein
VRHSKVVYGHAMAQAVSRRLLTEEARIRAQAISCGICGGKSGTGTLVFLCQCHSTMAVHTCVITWGMNNRPVGGRSSET